jgi:ABC-2 type transport system permease protein
MKLWTLTKRNLFEILRDPLTLILGLGLPVGSLLLFSALGSSFPLDIFTPSYLVPGIVVFSFSFLLMFAAMIVTKDRRSALMERIRLAGAGPWTRILSYGLALTPVMILQILLSLGLGLIWGYLPSANLLITGLSLLMPGLLLIFLGLLLGTLFTEQQIAGLGSVFITAASILGGTWMDLRMIGGAMENIAYALPFAHGVDLARIGLGADLPLDSPLSAAYLLALILAFLVLGAWSLRAKDQT